MATSTPTNSPDSPDSAGAEPRADAATDLKLVSEPTDSTAIEEGGAEPAERAEEPSESGTTDPFQPAAGAAGIETEERDRRGLPIWLFVLAFVLFSLAMVWQVRENRQLEGEVAGLEQELDATRALLGAHRDHLSEIRSGVHDLADRLEGLRGLVDTDPTESPKAARSARDPGDEEGLTPSGDSPRPIPSRLPQL